MANTTTPATSDPRTTKDLLDQMDQAWWPFRLAATSLGAAAMDRPTSAGWTYTQMLAHVAAWHALTARRLRAFRESGRTEPTAGEEAGRMFDELGFSIEHRAELLRDWHFDRFNAAVAEAAKLRAPADVLRELETSYGSLRREVEALSDAQVTDHVEDGRSFVQALVDGNAYGHYAEHREELAAAVPKTGTTLAARIDEDWARFREAVRHIGRAGLADRIPGGSRDGWTTYRDLVAHVIGWLEDVPRRIAAIRAGTHRPIASQAEIDEYNARSVASRALVGPEAMLDELDAAYRRMREAVSGLAPEEVRNVRILALVATRTYLHWEEHEKEMHR